MSLMKHFGEQGDKHNGRLFWGSAMNGLPYRGQNAPLLNQEELDTQVVVNLDFHFKLFDLSKEDDKAEYSWVMDRIVNKWFHLHYIDRKLVPDNKTELIYLEWSQRYGELSPTAKSKGQGYVYTHQNNKQIQVDK